ncbi:MAG: PRC-barrel domain-containing protein [Alphaproteobacteria bacterium]
MPRQTYLTVASLAAALGIALTAPASGQEQRPANASEKTAARSETVDIIALRDWDYQALYDNGWSARRLMDTSVYGPEGDEIGEVENIIIDENGHALAIIAEVGGFWDIGDTHVAVPWDEVGRENADRVTIPVREETVEDYSIFHVVGNVGATKRVAEDVTAGPRKWKATELLDDYVVLANDENYGYVSDLIFDNDGAVRSVIVAPASGHGYVGPFAYPFYRYPHAWSPGHEYYRLPYSREEVSRAELFDYNKMNDNGFGR